MINRITVARDVRGFERLQLGGGSMNALDAWMMAGDRLERARAVVRYEYKNSDLPFHKCLRSETDAEYVSALLAERVAYAAYDAARTKAAEDDAM